MKILLDENMPHNLVKALRAEGHDVESVHTLGIAGVKNGELYKIIRNDYDLLFTKDVGFNDWAKKVKEEHRVKYVLVALPQQAQDLFIKGFIAKFIKTDWPKHVQGNAWPKESK